MTKMAGWTSPTGMGRLWERRLLLASLFAGAFVTALGPISDGDIFWHLAAGREMVRRLDWIRTDPFTLSAAGRPWPDVHWLFQLGAFAIYQWAGLAGLVIAKALLVASGAVLLGRAVARVGGPGARAGEPELDLILCVMGLLGALFLARHLLLVRPVIVTLVMLAFFLAALEGARSGSRRALTFLPLLQVVWVNCQGLAVLGPVLVATYLLAAVLSPRAERQRWPFANERSLPRRALGITLVLCLVGMVATPYGREAFRLPAGLFLRLIPRGGNVFSAQVAENIPPWLWERTSPGETLHLAGAFAALAVCMALSRQRLVLSRLLVLIGFALLALLANRNVLLFYWLAAPMAAWVLAPRLREWGTRLVAGDGAWGPRWRRLGIPLVAVVLGGQLALAGVGQMREGEIGAPVAFHFPVESAKLLRSLAASGPVFAPDHQGGYLELMVPAVRPYIDTRLILHTAGEYTDYLEAVANPEKFDVLADAQQFQYVVLTTVYPDAYLGLVQHLAASADWRLSFTDGSEVLFARRGPSVNLGDRGTTSAILGGLKERFSGSTALHEAARLNLARLLIVLGETREAQAVLATLDSRAAAQMRARAFVVAGESAAAESLARILVDSDPHDVRSLALLAQLAIAAGDSRVGAQWLERALGADPYDLESLAVLERLERAAPSESAAP